MRGKMLNIAVIDSGVDIKNRFLSKRAIHAIRINGEKVEDCYNDNNHHGTAVCCYIFAECECVEITSIQSLNKNNKCSLSKLINAIEYAIYKNVDIINLSLGICIYDDKIKIILIVRNTMLGIVIYAHI